MAYEKLSRRIFGKHPGDVTNLNKRLSALLGIKWYSKTILQKANTTGLEERGKKENTVACSTGRGRPLSLVTEIVEGRRRAR
jgi:hypothetical protein